jgi:hypothetical protein
VTTTTISATVSDPAGLNYAKLYRRFFDGVNAPTSYVDAGAVDSAGSWSATIDPPDFPAPTDGGNPGRIDWYWEAQDTNGNTNLSGVASTTVYDCGSVIP